MDEVENGFQACCEEYTIFKKKNLYYVIFRIKGVTGLTGKISKQLKVTFTDGSTTLSTADEFDL